MRRRMMGASGITIEMYLRHTRSGYITQKVSKKLGIGSSMVVDFKPGRYDEVYIVSIDEDCYAWILTPGNMYQLTLKKDVPWIYDPNGSYVTVTIKRPM